jgi:hypothetical protein
MKSLVSLLELLLQDCGRKSGAPVARDIVTVRHRVKHEGDSFITITLPNFCSDFERSLEAGELASNAFLSFRKTRTGIPAFLQGFLSQVFDKDGKLLLEPSIDCIRSVRQICLFGKKVERACSEERTNTAIDGFKKCDREVTKLLSGDLESPFSLIADLLIRELGLRDSDPWEEDFVPKHGPGATRERISGNQKWVFRRWHYRLEFAGIKYWRFGKATSSPSLSSSNPVPEFVRPEDEEPSKVVFVPKTQKTPRVIAVEPVCMQYAQQGLSKVLVERLENHPLTSGRVNFTDQTVNQDLALLSSKSGKYATLDMAEASDRVSLAHVRTLFRSAPRFLEWIEACRTTRAQLPGGEVITLEKWASMGSALCFPIEALVFFTSIIASRAARLGLPITERLVRSLARDVYVYGDDLIVPADEAPLICDDLESFGFKVNRRKSFWTGQFRESCGFDCYGGEQVTPVYLRRDLPKDQKDVTGFVSWVATVNQLFSAGYYALAGAMRNALEKTCGKLPQVPENSPALGWHFHSEVVPRRRWNRGLQRFEELLLVPSAIQRADSLNGSEQALAKCFRLIGLGVPIFRPAEADPLLMMVTNDAAINPKHLTTSSRPYALTLKRKWVPVA